jgi:hypothetical protein
VTKSRLAVLLATKPQPNHGRNKAVNSPPARRTGLFSLASANERAFGTPPSRAQICDYGHSDRPDTVSPWTGNSRS